MELYSASSAYLDETSVPGPGWGTPRHLAWRVPHRMSKLDEEVKGVQGAPAPVALLPQVRLWSRKSSGAAAGFQN